MHAIQARFTRVLHAVVIEIVEDRAIDNAYIGAGAVVAEIDGGRRFKRNSQVDCPWGGVEIGGRQARADRNGPGLLDGEGIVASCISGGVGNERRRQRHRHTGNACFAAIQAAVEVGIDKGPPDDLSCSIKDGGELRRTSHVVGLIGHYAVRLVDNHRA